MQKSAYVRILEYSRGFKKVSNVPSDCIYMLNLESWSTEHWSILLQKNCSLPSQWFTGYRKLVVCEVSDGHVDAIEEGAGGGDHQEGHREDLQGAGGEEKVRWVLVMSVRQTSRCPTSSSQGESAPSTPSPAPPRITPPWTPPPWSWKRSSWKASSRNASVLKLSRQGVAALKVKALLRGFL